MHRHVHTLSELIRDSQYAVDPHAVAEAILARAATRCAVRGASFRNDPRASRPQVRSFRPTRNARSFRPCNAQ